MIDLIYNLIALLLLLPSSPFNNNPVLNLLWLRLRYANRDMRPMGVAS